MSIYRCDANVELSGNSTMALLQSSQLENFSFILERHGLSQIDSDAWYPLQDLLNVLEDISAEGGAMFSFVSIGIAAAQNSELPSEMANMPIGDFLEMYGRIYSTRHRNGDPGSITTEQISENHMKLLLDIPYPDDIFYGVIYGYVRRLRPAGKPFLVKYDEELPRKDQGGKYTVIHVTWE